jgi:hypothetical protein
MQPVQNQALVVTEQAPATPCDDEFSTFQQVMYISVQDMIDLSGDEDIHLSDSPEMHVDVMPDKKSPNDDYQDSTHQRFGPGKKLHNWFPDSGASAHFTPVFEDLINPRPDEVPVLVADGTIPYATHVGDVLVEFPTDQGRSGLMRLRSVRYIPGLSRRLFLLIVFSAAPNYSVGIDNWRTVLHFGNGITYTWPIHRTTSSTALMARIINDDSDDDEDDRRTDDNDPTTRDDLNRE